MVYLIGAGAGDVGLLTLKACELLRAADVVIYDRLIDDTLINYCAGAKKNLRRAQCLNVVNIFGDD